MPQTEKLTIEQFVQQGLSERAYITIAGEITHANATYQFTFRPSAQALPSPKDCLFNISCKDSKHRVTSEDNIYILRQIKDIFGKNLTTNHNGSGEIQDLHHYTKETIALKTAQIFDQFNKPPQQRLLSIDYRL